MDEFFKSVSTASWWIGLFVGLLLNLLSSYVKPPLDRFASAVSSGWRARSEAARQKRLQHVELLRTHPELQLLERAAESRLRQKAIYESVRAGTCLVMLALVVLVTDHNPTAASAPGNRWVYIAMVVSLGLLFFFSATSAHGLAGAANDAERRLRAANAGE